VNRRSRREDYLAVFDNPQGKRVLKHLCRVGYVDKSTFVSGDPHQTSLNEGMRRIVLSILKLINTEPQEILEEEE